MRVLATFALLAAPALAFMPAAPLGAARVNSRLVLNAGGEYSSKVREIVMENMGGDAKVADYLKANADDKADFSEMGFDSLDLVEFSMAIQKEFALPDLAEDDVASLKTISDVVALVEKTKA